MISLAKRSRVKIQAHSWLVRYSSAPNRVWSKKVIVETKTTLTYQKLQHTMRWAITPVLISKQSMKKQVDLLNRLTKRVLYRIRWTRLSVTSFLVVCLASRVYRLVRFWEHRVNRNSLLVWMEKRRTVLI